MRDDLSIEIKLLSAGDEAMLKRVASGMFDHHVQCAVVPEFLAIR
ncbi:MAG TPA: hypothetical protein VGR35_11445 [Tepidisphaeraceae bacterium]|nr:hypothetical protein [Tepidisphaeraceae bacterium]